jgi:hypothetical protein
MFTYLKMLFSDWNTVKSALSVGLQHLSWASTDSGAPIASELATNPVVQTGE